MAMYIRRMVRIAAATIIISALSAIIVNAPWFRRMAYPIHYQGPIAAYARANRVDPFLIAAIIKVESRYNAKATSHRGARGLMQIMPQTGEWAAGRLGLTGYTADALFDPDTNIAIGSWYVSQLLKQADGNLTTALAAYNGGPTHVERWISDGIWSGEAHDAESIPFPETARYVTKVMKAHQAYIKAYGGRWPGDVANLGS